MATAADITPEQMASYREGARRRQAREREALRARERRAWDLARLAADILRQQFGVTRVVVFGSLIHPGSFTPWSDVDIAAWGIKPEGAFRAVMDLFRHSCQPRRRRRLPHPRAARHRAGGRPAVIPRHAPPRQPHPPRSERS